MHTRRFFWSILILSELSLVLTACQPIVVTPSPTSTRPNGATPTEISRQPTATLTSVPPSATPAATNTITATTTITPTITASPTQTSTPTSTPTPEAALRQLTQGGCCTQPFFSPDGRQVLFLDKPTASDPAGIYGLTLANAQPTPTLINDTIGFRNPARTIVGTITGDLVRLTNEITEESWTFDTGGNWPRFSPDGRQILWVATDREGPYDQRRSDVWLADLNGDNRRLLLSTFGGRTATWFPDSERILLTGRDQPWQEELTIFIYEIASGQRTDLYSHKRIRGGDLSPDGSWVAYFLSFADAPEDNGLWLINTADTTRRKVEIPTFGAFRWGNDDTLLYIPFRDSIEDSMQLWAIDAATGEFEPLTDPAELSFSISNGDWDVSPDGQHVVFVSSEDENIWLITLP